MAKRKNTGTVAQKMVEVMLNSSEDLNHQEMINSYRKNLNLVSQLSESDQADFTRSLISMGFKESAEDFILALSKNLKINFPINEGTLEFPRAVFVAANIIHDNAVNSGRHMGDKTLSALYEAHSMFADNRGRICHIMRLCARMMHFKVVENFGDNLPKHEKEIKNLLADCMLAPYGSWDIWKRFREEILATGIAKE
jgi:hypothetical protein